MSKASDFIREIDLELAKFLDEELRDVPDCKYPTDNSYIPTTNELKEFTLDELTDILMDASSDADMYYKTEKFEQMNQRYEIIKELVMKERSIRCNDFQDSGRI